MVEPGTRLSAVEHSGRQHRYYEAELLQQPPEEPIELIAETTSPPPHDLVVERWEREDDRVAQGDVEILERHGEHVGPMKLPQSLGCRVARALVTDPLQIRAYLHG